MGHSQKGGALSLLLSGYDEKQLALLYTLGHRSHTHQSPTAMNLPKHLLELQSWEPKQVEHFITAIGG